MLHIAIYVGVRSRKSDHEEDQARNPNCVAEAGQLAGSGTIPDLPLQFFHGLHDPLESLGID